MLTKFLSLLLLVPFWFQNLNNMPADERAKLEAQNAELGSIIQKGPKRPFEANAIKTQLPGSDKPMARVSWVAADKNGLTYLLQRNNEQDNVVVVDRSGKIVRSWGKGMYKTAHAIRV